MVFHLSLSDRKSPQVSGTLLNILADLNSLAVGMVSTRSTISRSSSHFNNPLMTVPRAPITIGITVTFMPHNFFSLPSQGRDTYPSFIFLSILLCGQLGQQSPQIASSLFWFIGLVARMLANGPEDLGLISGRVIPKT